jgi:hypothetical protein
MSAGRAVIALRGAKAEKPMSHRQVPGITPSIFIVEPIASDRSVSKLDHSFMVTRKLRMQPEAVKIL